MYLGNKHTILTSLTIALVVLVMLMAAPRAMAQSCDLPLTVQAAGSPANVLIILDSSGSMREVIYHEDYDPLVNWSGPFTALSAYGVNSDGWYTPSSFDGTWATTPSVHLVTSQAGQGGRYMGNYLNWLFFHATDTHRAEQPQTTRIEVGKAAVQSLISQGQGLRFGLMKFNGDTGGLLVSPIGTTSATVSSDVDGVQAGGVTPAAETLVTALEHFQDDVNGPIQDPCQRNYIIMVTDGYPTSDLDVPVWIGDQDGDGNEPGDCESIQAPEPLSANCSDYLDDVAYYLANNDMRPDLPGDQTVTVHTIGFGVEVPLLVDAAANGNGTYSFAWNSATLSASLSAVVGSIIAEITAGSAVAVVSAEQESDSRLYRAKFLPGLWKGYLEAFAVPYEPSDSPVWDAGLLLQSRSYNDRAVFTSFNGTMIDFDAGSSATLQASLGAASEAEATDIIEYTLGKEIAGFRDRDDWKLGDIVHSSPLVVAGPAEFHLDQDYQSYLQTQANRTPVVYVGANDGMLHAFQAETGVELWAYVPEALHGALNDLTDPAYCHTSYVDLAPVAYEVKLNGSWRTVLVSGRRTGGDVYFALDVTNPYAPSLMWEVSIPTIQSAFTQPAIVRTANATYLWTGSGPDLGGSATAALVDVSTGNLVFTSAMGSIAGTNMATAATAYDADWDGTTDYVYQADLSGTLWRWDLTGSSDPANWQGQSVFSCGQPIQARPTLSLAPDGRVAVYFGTGQYIEANDLSDVALQSFYCVFDDGTATGLTAGSLVDQTSAIQELGSAPGWKIDLVQAAGERVIQPAKLVEGVVYFTSFAPNSGDCTLGGEAWLYRARYLDGNEPEGGSLSHRVVELEDGVPSTPVVDLDRGQLVVQTSDARMSVVNMSVAPRTIFVQSWRETLD